jgi:hypothetical protein
MSPLRRLAGMRDAPWDAPSFVLSEMAIEATERTTRLASALSPSRPASSRGQAQRPAAQSSP